MKPVGIVVQRWHSELAGGSEQHAGLYARYLAEAGFKVDLITTTARDAQSWANEYEAGESEVQGFRILRFPVAGGRRADWPRMHDLLLREATAARSEGFRGDFFRDAVVNFPPKIRWPRALQEEWIRRQGPHSPELIEYLRGRSDEYGCVIFLTYLFSPTYFGSAVVPPRRSLFVPTLHDEAPAYMPAFARMAGRVGGILWNTEAEEQLGQSLWGPFPPSTAHHRGGMGIDIPEAKRSVLRESPTLAVFADETVDFALYSGRISEAKGCREMIDWYLAARRAASAGPGNAAAQAEALPSRLVLTGDLQMELPEDPALLYVGFVSAEEKFALMAAARLFIMPSAYESLSVVTLEALGQGTPVLGNAHSPVIQDHILRSGAGRLYRDRGEFEEGLRTICARPAGGEGQQDAMRAGARDYVAEHYSHAQVSARVVAAVRRAMAE